MCTDNSNSKLTHNLQIAEEMSGLNHKKPKRKLKKKKILGFVRGTYAI